MPTISMFYGILIRMHYADHNPPHFHAIYENYKAMFSLDGEMINGNMPRKQQRIIGGWAAIHQEELKANWELSANHEELYKIEPLK